MTTTEWATRHGAVEMATQNEILRTVVGSGVHGIAIEGTDDHDEMAVYVEPLDTVLGDGAPHATLRTQPEGKRSGPGDIDLVAYSLRRYLSLATKGNPTVLLPLWCPDYAVLNCTDEGQLLRDHRKLFLTKGAVHRFLGYMRGQRERMESGRRTPNRPELVARYGYDVKYASHALRLSIQALEIVQHGTLTLPMPDRERRQVTDVKLGLYSQKHVQVIIDMNVSLIEDALPACGLPARPDYAKVAELTRAIHQKMW